MRNKISAKGAFVWTAVLFLCVVYFIFGRMSVSEGTITYLVDGIPTSFNRAWPTYGLPLINYENTLLMIRNGNSEETIPYLEAYLDAAVYDAECRLPLVRPEERRAIEKALRKVALYRRRFPRAIRKSSDRDDQFWINRQENVDAFLRPYAITNSAEIRNVGGK